MSSLRQLKANARVLLNSPRPQQPSERLLMLVTVRQVQAFMNRLSNTGRAWATSELSLFVSPDVTDYALDGGSTFGKPLHVYTVDSSNAGHVERSVDFYEPQNLNADWGLPNDAAESFLTGDGSNHTAQRLAIFRLNGALTARVKPTPKQPAEYKILFSVGNWVDAAGLADSPVLSEHHSLIETRIARAALPHSAWWDDEAENRRRRAELDAQLRDDEAVFASDFHDYVDSLTQPRVSFRGPGD